MKILFILLILLNVKIMANSFDTSEFGKIPIVYRGRVVPFDTFARVISKQLAQNIGLAGKDPVKFCLQFFDTSIQLKDIKAFSIKSSILQNRLDISDNKRLYSQKELFSMPAFIQFSNYYNQKSKAERKEQADLKAYSKLANNFKFILDLVSGKVLFMFPMDREKTNWLNLPSLYQEKTKKSIEALDYFSKLLIALRDKNQINFNKSSLNLKNFIYLNSKGIDENKLDLEINYNHFEPFSLSYFIYIFTLLLFIVTRNKNYWYLPLMTGFLGFTFTTLGLLSRSFILARPPLANVFESIIFASWICVLSAHLLFYKKEKQNFYIISIFTALLILSSKFLLPISEDLLNLEVVLRSNLWLGLHVCFVVSSFAILSVSSVLSHYYLFLSSKKLAIPDSLIFYIHNNIKMGVFLLGVGTVLGGIWANSTWGRFWGWDPKETWVLITLIVYMILLHCKRMSWLSDYIVALASILSFLFILITWYGVNFIIGTGLHSYGFGTGDIKLAILFVLFELLFITSMQRKRMSLIHA
ncbi:MAG: hypothetical protein COB02_15470 [Candidatus Cloacimonadota bacterium]|nr:MAG: hypothetical protein COB02_15470 [Candidatus Cloacimonadota bacterium]